MPTPRFTLDCQAVPWNVIHVEESNAPARPPSVVVDVATNSSVTEITDVERATASLLIEGPNVSRVVRAWVRYVEHIGVVDSRTHFRLHLVPIAMAEHAPARRVETPVNPPALVAAPRIEHPAEAELSVEPAIAAMMPTSQVMESRQVELDEGDVTAQHTPEELRAMRGEDDGDDNHRRLPPPRPSPRARREPTEVVPRSHLQDPAPKQPPSAEADSTADGTRLITFTELNPTPPAVASTPSPRTPPPPPQRRPSRSPAKRTEGTEMMSREDLERLLLGAKPEPETRRATTTRPPPHPTRPQPRPSREDRTEPLAQPSTVTETERLKLVSEPTPEPPPRRDAREHLRERSRKKKAAEDGTNHMTWQEIEAFHRDRGKPKK